MVVTFGKDVFKYVMDSGNFRIFRKLNEEEIKTFCVDCDCEGECYKYKKGCTSGDCNCK